MDRDATQAYDRAAARYDRRWRDYTDETLVRAIRLIAAEPPGVLLDVACGTGELLRRLVALRIPGRLVGVDGSEAMVRVARAKLRDARDVSLQQAKAEALPFADGTFDWVVCCNSLHVFLDAARAAREMRRVLRPHGRLVLVDWCRNPWHCRLVNWWKARFDPSHVRMYTAEELAALLTEAALSEVRVERFRVGGIGALKLWDMMGGVARRR